MKKIIDIKLNNVPTLNQVFGNEALKSIFKAISNPDAIEIELSPADIISYLRIEQKCYPRLYKFSFTEHINQHSLDISNDEGETYPVTLTWKEVSELNNEYEKETLLQEKIS